MCEWMQRCETCGALLDGQQAQPVSELFTASSKSGRHPSHPKLVFATNLDDLRSLQSCADHSTLRSTLMKSSMQVGQNAHLTPCQCRGRLVEGNVPTTDVLTNNAL